jgi:hypothetical protein
MLDERQAVKIETDRDSQDQSINSLGENIQLFFEGIPREQSLVIKLRPSRFPSRVRPDGWNAERLASGTLYAG